MNGKLFSLRMPRILRLATMLAMLAFLLPGSIRAGNVPAEFVAVCSYDGSGTDSYHLVRIMSDNPTVSTTLSTLNDFGFEANAGATGLNIAEDGEYYYQGGEIDQSTNTFYLFFIDHNTTDFSLQTIDLATGKATKAGDLPDQTYQVTGVTIPTETSDAGSPDAVGDLAVSFAGGCLTGTVSFKVPVRTFDGGSLSENGLCYEVFANGMRLDSVATAPGASVETSVTLPAPGSYVIEVACRNGKGSGPKSKLVTQWLGYDTPSAPENVTLTLDKKTGLAQVTWDAPGSGVHDGYLGALEYNVYRITDNEEKPVSQAQTGTTFSELLSRNSFRYVRYAVEAINGTQTGQKAISDNCVLSSLSVPFEEQFNTVDVFSLWTVIDANEDGKTWEWYSSLRCAYYKYSGDNDGNDWLVSAPISLEEGTPYEFSCDASCYFPNYPERFEVRLGKGNAVADFTQVLIGPQDLTSDEFQTFSSEFTVTESGEYHVAVHAISDPNEFYMFVDNVRMDHGVDPTAPAIDEDGLQLEATAGMCGKMEATVRFNVPVRSVAGLDLDPEEQILCFVYRNGSLVGSASGSVGEHMTYHDTDFDGQKDGTYSYKVRFANNGGLDYGPKSAPVSVYVGQDIPLDPENVIISDVPGGLAMSWSPVGNAGRNGGYVDPDSVTYSVYSIESGNLGQELYSGSDTTCLVATDPNVGEQHIYSLALGSRNGKGDSGYKEHNTITGAPYPLPYEEHFSASNGFDGTGYFNSNDSCSWYVDEESADGDGQSLRCFMQGNTSGYVSLGKVSLGTAANPMWIFNYNVTPGDDITIEPVVFLPNGSRDTLDHIDVSKMEGDRQWLLAKCDLSRFVSENYIRPYVIVRTNASLDHAVDFVIDNSLVDDFHEYNLKVGYAAPGSVVLGDSIPVDVTVFNHGLQTVQEYTVSLASYGNVIFSRTVSEPIAPLERVSIAVKVPTSSYSVNDSISIRVSVSCQSDEYTDDNTAEFKVGFTWNGIASVTGLAVSMEGGNATISWNPVCEEFCESFEDAEKWTLDQPYGGFTSVNNDNGVAGGIFNGYSIGFEGKGFAFTVWNSDDVNDSSGNFTAHSGTQCLAATYKVNEQNTDYVPNDSWLISPQMNGKAQTVSFWVRSADSNFLDTYKVMYSLSGKELSDFQEAKAQATAPASWTEVSADLPEGTQYFAIVCNSSDGLVFMLDDISYGAVRCSYNIYENGTFICNTADTAYTLPSDPDLYHMYSVTTVMGDFESVPASIEIGSQTDDGLPGAVGDLAVSFTDGSLTGTVSFKVPSTTTLGGDLSGEGLCYEVYANGMRLDSVATAPGASVETGVTLPAPGSYVIEVACRNGKGSGPKSKLVTQWIGYDTPYAPENVTLAFDTETGKADVTWNAPGAGVHDGYLGTLEYDVYRMTGKDTVLVSASQTGTAFSETLPVDSFSTLRYAVEAINGTQTSLKSESDICHSREWTDWEPFAPAGEAAGKYTYGCYFKGEDDSLSIFVRSSNVQKDRKQFKIADWCNGMDLHIDYDESTGLCRVPLQNIHEYNKAYADTMWVGDFGYMIKESHFNQHPCTYNPATGTFSLILMYTMESYIGSGGGFYNGAKPEIFQMYGTFAEYTLPEPYLVAIDDENVPDSIDAIGTFKFNAIEKDIAGYRIRAFTPTDYGNLDMNALDGVMNGVLYNAGGQGQVTFQGGQGKYHVLFAGYDSDGRIVAHNTVIMQVENRNRWETVGIRPHREGLITGYYYGANNPDVIDNVELQRNRNDMTCYRLKNPYGKNTTFGSCNQFENAYIYFHIDPSTGAVKLYNNDFYRYYVGVDVDAVIENNPTPLSIQADNSNMADGTFDGYAITWPPKGIIIALGQNEYNGNYFGKERIVINFRDVCLTLSNEDGLYIGETLTVSTDNGFNRPSYESLTPEIASVSADGVVTALSDGIAQIRVIQDSILEYNRLDSVISINVKGIPEPVVLNSSGYATFSSSYPMKVGTEGVKAYKAEINADEIILTLLDGDIPQCTGVLLYGGIAMAGRNVSFRLASADSLATGLADNVLQSTTMSDGNVVSKPSGTVWVLGPGDEFRRYTGSAFIANRAYISYELPSNAPMRMAFADDNTTLKENVTMPERKTVKIIENGRIVIIRNGRKYDPTGQEIK